MHTYQTTVPQSSSQTSNTSNNMWLILLLCASPSADMGVGGCCHNCPLLVVDDHWIFVHYNSSSDSICILLWHTQKTSTLNPFPHQILVSSQFSMVQSNFWGQKESPPLLSFFGKETHNSMDGGLPKNISVLRFILGYFIKAAITHSHSVRWMISKSAPISCSKYGRTSFSGAEGVCDMLHLIDPRDWPQYQHQKQHVFHNGICRVPKPKTIWQLFIHETEENNMRK